MLCIFDHKSISWVIRITILTMVLPCSNSYEAFGIYRGSPHSTSSHSTDFSIARFFKNMNSSHKKVHPLYSTVFTVVLYYIFIKITIPLIARISHSTVFSCSGKTVLWGDPLYREIFWQSWYLARFEIYQFF